MTADATETLPFQPTLVQIGRVFLVLGAVGFGGQGALLVLLNRDLVARRGWLTEPDITEAFTYTKLLPGSTVVQVVAYLGWKLGGGLGTAVATVCFLLPPVVFMLTLAIVYRFVASLGGVRSTLNGLTAAVVGLVVVATGTLGKKNITDLLGLLVAVVACALSVVLEINPALLVVVAGLLSITLEFAKGQGKESEDAQKEPENAQKEGEKTAK